MIDLPLDIALPTSSSTGSAVGGPTSFEAAAHTLTLAFEALSVGKLFRDPQQDRALPEAKVFIVSWVDFSHKYGMGYALTDGSVGVRYNDSTSIVVSPDKSYVIGISVPEPLLTVL